MTLEQHSDIKNKLAQYSNDAAMWKTGNIPKTKKYIQRITSTGQQSDKMDEKVEVSIKFIKYTAGLLKIG